MRRGFRRMLRKGGRGTNQAGVFQSGTVTEIQIRKRLEMKKPAWRLQILGVALGIVHWY